MTTSQARQLRERWRFRRPTLLLFLGIAGGGGWLQSAAIAEPSIAAEQDVIVRMVLDSISANYAQIHTAHLCVNETVRDASVQNVSTVEHLTASGSNVATVKEPLKTRKLDVWIDGDKVRVDRKAGVEGNAGEEVYILSDGVWTQYMGRVKAAWRRRPGEMPGMLPLDPRQYGANDIRRDLSRVFQEDEIVSAAMTRDKEGKVVARIVAKAHKGNETIYEFSAAAGYLPTRLMTFWPDGSVLQLIDVTYKQVAERVWMPGQLVQRFYAQTADVDVNGNGWRQECVREVTGEIMINKSIPESQFEFEMPLNTQVSDNIKSAFYRTAALTPADRSPLLFWLTVTGACILLLITVYKHTSSALREAT